ncbi:MAG: peptidase C60 sortase A and B [uncultured bacterium]|nr:MAG: peptidase C60 sortase A and B [uncultured bacterium]HCS38665.1 hypothetical protein [Anaerolineaceae bacterium]
MDRNDSEKLGLRNKLFYFRRQIFLAILLLIVTFIVSNVQNETRREDEILSASHSNNQNNPSQMSVDAIKQSIRESKIIDRSNSSRIGLQTATETAKSSILGSDYDSTLDLHAGPVEIPLKIIIPILDVDAPILAVGLTEDNNMDAPKGLYGDPNWSSTFWYRGSAIPGEPGTSTIAGHVNGLLGEPETFSRIRKLKPGDLIIIKEKITNTLLYFVVDEVFKYSMVELNEPEINDRIFGGTIGSDGQKLTDGLSHLTLITCTGNYKDGEFDHRIVVFSTQR